MDSLSKDGDSDSGEYYGLKISDLLKILAEREPPPVGRRHIGAALSALRSSAGTFRSRAVLPEKLGQLSRCRFERRDQLRESAAASPPAPGAAVASCREGQPAPGSPSPLPVIFALLAGKSAMLPSEVHPHILGVQAWTRGPSRGAPWTPPGPSLPTGPTSGWFFEDLVDLQRKLFLGASKKSGVPRTHQDPASLPVEEKDAEKIKSS